MFVRFAWIAIIPLAAFISGFWLDSVSVLPASPVYIDNKSKTYFAGPCLRAWVLQNEGLEAVLTTTAAARKLGFKPDPHCENAGFHRYDDISVSVLFLMKLGVIAPLENWWED